MKTIEIKDPPARETLVAVFGRCRSPFLLESLQSRYGLGEWSFYGAEPFEVLRGLELGDFREAMRGYAVPGHREIPFCGGAVGYLSYDYGRRLEKVPEIAVDDRDIPDFYFGLFDGVAAWHHPTGRLFLTGCGVSESPERSIERMRGWLEEAPPEASGGLRLGSWEWNMDEAAFATAVAQVRGYIASGDIYQVNLARRATCRFEGDRLKLYEALRRGNPAPYSAYLEADDLTLISTSPEQFIRKRGGELQTRPIKGTRPRGGDAREDAAQEAQLRDSAKERAELLMIVDLERNDLGRVAEFGSVRVDGLYQLERYASVIHQTAQVRATLAPGRDIYDVLRATFPGGSITGAPKIRAMEIIEALEPTRRGAYCGSIGYVGFDGNAEFNIAIRGLQLNRGRLDYQVGSGIVWDSTPAEEYQETLDKARAIRETLDAL